jgi:hypothetical protein
MVGCYKGKCSGSIRSIAKHPQLPLIASCGKLIKLVFFILFNSVIGYFGSVKNVLLFLILLRTCAFVCRSRQLFTYMGYKHETSSFCGIFPIFKLRRALQ